MRASSGADLQATGREVRCHRRTKLTALTPTEGEAESTIAGRVRDRFFDPWRAPRTEKAKGLVADVIRQLEAYERHRRPRRRQRKQQDQAVFEETVAAIICDLVHAVNGGANSGQRAAQ
jgi:hypothetical protein